MELVDLAQFASITLGIAALVFIVAYALLARFWKTQEGLNAWLMAVFIFLAVIVSVIGRAGAVDVSRILNVIISFLVAGILFWRTGLLLRAQGITLNRRRPPTQG